jgi:hypothetical protein
MSQPAYELINGGDNNPYHLLIYMIANFIITDISKPLIYFYPKSESSLAEELLALLPPHFTRHFKKDPALSYISFMNVKPYFHDWTMPHDYEFLRALFAPHISPAIRPGLKIYISRRDAKQRRIVNEDQLLAALIPNGFIPVVMSKLTASEQIRLFSEAETIIAPHGAALAFMVFMNKNASLIELNGPMSAKRHYSHIAWHLDLDYYKVRCKPVGSAEDIEVDVDRVLSIKS